MKPQTFLILSLAGNVALVAAAYHYLRPAHSPGISSVAASKTGGQAGKFSTATNVTLQVATNFVADDFTWGKVESEDYKTYIANLRAIGCPEMTIRDIIVADVNKLFSRKRRDISGDTENTYWKTEPNSWSTKEGYERQKRYRELDKQKTALLVELLGVDPDKERRKEMGYLDYWERQFDFLTDDKKTQARAVQEKFEEQRQGLYRNGIVDEEDQKALRAVEAAQKAELAQFLTPTELEQYQLRASQAANQLRWDLDAFEPSEEEFKTVFRLRKAREEDLAYAYDPDDKVGQERRNKAVKETDEQIKMALGATRFDEYKMGQDYSYKELARMADRLELPKGTAKGVYDMKKVAEEQVKQVRENKELTSEQRNLALAAIRTETENAVIASLGSKKNLDRYKMRGGYWISNLAPTPRPPTAAVVKP